ncbi:MAG: metallophosphoesterase [Planctomycetota bacterium]
MKLWAISDLHLGYDVNKEAVAALPPYPEDWLILAGDTGDCLEHLQWALDTLRPRFRQMIWVPGNHDLWCVDSSNGQPRGVDRYETMVAMCRRAGVLTPEDPYAIFHDGTKDLVLAPLFLLYDYSFAPDGRSPEEAVLWALESGIVCADERYLHADPFNSRADWCRARCDDAERRLIEVEKLGLPTVLINHFPLRRDLAVLPRVPRFLVWCGTQVTENWHVRFRAEVVVSGHLHIRTTRWRDNVRCEEVSLGYPRQWEPDRGIVPYLRQILPAPERYPFAREIPSLL